MVVNHLMWVLGTELGSSGKSPHALNCRVTSTVLDWFFFPLKTSYNSYLYGVEAHIQIFRLSGRFSDPLDIPLCPVLSIWKNLASRHIELEQHPSPHFYSLLIKAHRRTAGRHERSLGTIPDKDSL